MVKRYLIGGYGEHEHPNGDFVHWQDYHALRAELEQVKRELEAQTLRAERAELQLSVHVAERLAGAGVVSRKLELWFFRDMSDEQRLKLFVIFGMPVDEIGKTHGHQRIALRRILSALAEPAGEAELVAWQRLHPTEGWVWVRPEDAEHYTKMGQAIRPLYTTPPDASAIKALPATGPYVDRLIRIFCGRSDDDGSAVVLQDYARAALAGAKP